MIITHRRMNLLQAYKMADHEWVSGGELALMGAYGTPQSIHRAFLRLRAQGAVDIRKCKATGDHDYRFTHRGICAMGLTPTKREHHHGREEADV